MQNEDTSQTGEPLDEPQTESDADNANLPPEAAPDTHILEPENPLPKLTIADLPPPMREAASRAGWSSLTAVQEYSIPYVLEGMDLMVQSRTGSGKTGAYILPILDRVDPGISECQALVLVPTRELAVQVARQAEELSAGSGINIVSVYGGTAYGAQLEGFRQGAHIVIGTPGRILDHLMRHSLRLNRLDVLVFDEADRLMSMGFYPDMVQLRGFVPENRSSYMFSATFPYHVRALADQFLYKPGLLSLSHDKVHVTEMEHVYYEVPAMDKDRALVRVIEIENPTSGIIFCNTKDRVNYVATVLQRFGYDADQLTSDLSQKARERVLERLRQRNLRFLVATDLAARGIDISGLSHVFIYEFPEDPESYIHRAGRTARAGAGGMAISLVSTIEAASLERVAKMYKIEMEKREPPTDAEVAVVASERLTALLEAKRRTRDRLQGERMQRFLPLAKSLGQTDDELELLAMLLDDYYQQVLHASPETPETVKPQSGATSSSSRRASTNIPHRGSGERGTRGHRGKGRR
jgi:ATP-dependent RNA helicase DeaD